MSSIDRLGLSGILGIVCLLGASTIGAADWNVTDTGQPYTDVQFSVTEGTWMSLDVSPDGKTLVFDMLGDIYSLPVTGGEAKLVHGGPAMDIDPRFSPDGKRLLFVSDRSGSYNLWTSAADGLDARQVSRETVTALQTPSWSADGRYVAGSKFHSRRTAPGGLWLYPLDGGSGRQLLDDASTNVSEPVFSHDGRHVYYTERVGPPSYVFTNTNQPIFAIKRRELSSEKVEEVVGGFGSATTAQLSPDDSRIAFLRRVKEKTVLFVYDLSTGRQYPVHDGLDRDMQAAWNLRYGYYPHFAWFPDNRHVAIWSGGKLHKIDTQTQAREQIPFHATVRNRIAVPLRVEHSLTPERFTVRTARQSMPSPDGKTVLFNALGRLWQKPLAGGAPQRMTQSERFEFEPSFSRDGGSVAFVSWDDEQGAALEVMTVKGRKVTTLLQGVGIIRQPMFSPDGQRLVYWLERGDTLLGGYSAKGGMYWLSIADGKPHFLAASGQHPQFSPDGRRIYYVTATGNAIESVALDGGDKRGHAVSQEATELRLSPDLNWLSYKLELQLYVAPFKQTGAPVRVTKFGGEAPVVKLTHSGGYETAWSTDSRRLTWLLGDRFFTAQIGAAAPAPGKVPITAVPLRLELVPDKPEGTLAFTNGRIITMRPDASGSQEVIEGGTVVVSGNRIVAVGRVDQVKVPDGAKIVDIAGKTVMPGFMDMHGHLDTAGGGLLTPQKRPTHYAAVAFGVTSNFDPSGSLASSEMSLAGVSVGPRLIATGEIIHGLTDFVGYYHPIATLEDARNIVAARKSSGATVVKSYMQPMRSQRQQILKAAREANVMVVPEGESHFYNDLSMIFDGHLTVEHNLPVANYYDDIVQLLTHTSTSLTPTIVVSNGETPAENYFYETTRPWDDPKVKAYVQTTLSGYSPIGSAAEAPPYARGMISVHQAEELWDIGFRATARAIKKADDAGVVVNAGAHGQIEGLSIHWEMWAMAEGGMSNYRVLRAATLNGAKTLALDKQIGSLEVGKLADLIVLDANPLENIRNTNTVRYTMVNGRLYDSLSMNEIGNYNRPRTRFYWELPDYKGIDWNEYWGGPGLQLH